MNECVKGLSQNDVVTYPRAFLSGYTQILEAAFGTFGSVDRCQVLLENEISISIKLDSRKKHEVL